MMMIIVIVIIIIINRPDIVLYDKDYKPCFRSDIALLVDSHVNTKVTEKLSKFINLEIAVRRMRKVRTKIVLSYNLNFRNN